MTSVAPTLLIQNAPANPHGTFVANANKEIVITYNPRLVRNPIQLVATYAHELAHYLTGTGSEAPPGGWENWEFATDVAATFLGFGVFMANAAFTFQQFAGTDSQGWQYTRSGYLSQGEHLVALAIFLALQGTAAEVALPHLKPGLRKMLKKAVRDVTNAGLIPQLRAVEYEPSGRTPS